jgi:hypothetical protein|tara:strand:+ start:1787 stop:2023 length:237 start_codon:yes stop_codon:yes gene_type:complete
MALSDDGREAAEWASLVPGFLRGLGQMTGDLRFDDAADAIGAIGLVKLAEELARLRADRVHIDAGTLEIGAGVDVEIG